LANVLSQSGHFGINCELAFASTVCKSILEWLLLTADVFKEIEEEEGYWVSILSRANAILSELIIFIMNDTKIAVL
jgi:hypothetical protein